MKVGIQNHPSKHQTHLNIQNKRTGGMSYIVNTPAKQWLNS